MYFLKARPLLSALVPARFLPLLADLLACLRFYSRMPVPILPFETAPHAMPDFSRVVRMLPLAGVVIALPAVLVLALCLSLGLAPNLAALLALSALVMTTGAFHEDGLADMADGFGGGMTRERKLEIMKDSRIGTYGGAALVLSLLVRAQAIALLTWQGGFRAGLVVVAAAALSRAFGLLPLALLSPARTDGAAFAAAKPQPAPLAIAFGLAFALAFLPAFAGMAPSYILTAFILAGLAAGMVTLLSHKQIQGQTGDVAGAAQQMAEIAFLLALSAG